MSAIDDKVLELLASGWDVGSALMEEMPLADASTGRTHRRFERGWLLADPAVGVWMVWGPALPRFADSGGPDVHGFPTWAGAGDSGDSWWWTFEDHTAIVQSIDTARLLTDTLGAAWALRGGSAVFGLPADDALAVGDGWVVHLPAFASLHQPPVPANWLLTGRLNMEYWNLGGPLGQLGWPTADSTDVGDDAGTQDATFEHGTLRTTTTGEVTATALDGSALGEAPAGPRERAAQLIASYVPSDTGDATFDEIAKDYTGGGTTCGFLCHWLLWRLGAREQGFVNRSEPADGLDYVDSLNMTRLFHGGRSPFVTVLGTRKIADGLRPNTGDCVYVKTDVSPENSQSGKGEHVFVFSHVETDSDGNEIWHSADAGQTNAAGRQCARLLARQLHVAGTTAQLNFNGEWRHIVGWVDLDAVAFTA